MRARKLSAPLIFFILMNIVAGSAIARTHTAVVAQSNPVILVHGFKDDAKKMQAMARALRSEGQKVFTPTLSPSWCQVGNDVLARQLADYIDANLPRGARFDLVGFSMGGIVSRYYLQRLGGLSRVDHFVAISAPEHGTWWASILPAKSLRRPGAVQLRPGSDFLRDLDRDVETLNRVSFTTIWTPLDLTIIPASSSRMPVGREIKLWVVLHPFMVWQPNCLRAVAAALRD